MCFVYWNSRQGLATSPDAFATSDPPESTPGPTVLI